MIKITVCGQSISGEYSPAASDSIDYISAYFSFTDDWDGLDKTAQFSQGENTFNVILENDFCTLPNELTDGKVLISVFGQEAGGTKRITTIPFELHIRKSGFCSDASSPIPPTPDLYSQLLDRINSEISNIPSKLSEFENDSGYVTYSEIPSKISQLENDSGYALQADIPEKTSQLANDSGYITPGDIPGYIATESYVNDKLSEYLPLTGGSISGNLSIGEALSLSHEDNGYGQYTSTIKGYYGGGDTLNLYTYYLNMTGYKSRINFDSNGILIDGYEGSGEVRIKDISTPIDNADAANKKYVDDKTIYDITDGKISTQSGYLTLGDGTEFSKITIQGGRIDAGYGVQINNLQSPILDNDAVNKKYVDDKYTVLSQSEYDAITEKEPDKIYFVYEDET